MGPVWQGVPGGPERVAHFQQRGFLVGFLDDAKDKLSDAVDSQGDKIGDGLDKAADLVSDRTGGKYDDKLETGVDKAKDALDGLDGKDDDIK
jgi:hypothetical protein